MFRIITLLLLILMAGCSNDEGPPAASAQPVTTATASASASTSPVTSASADGLDDDDIPIDPEVPASVSGSATPPPPPIAKSTDPKTAPPPEPSPEPAPVAAPPVPPAKKGSAEEMADKVDAIYKPIKRFRAKFEQKYVAKVAGTTKKSNGVVYVERPEKLSLSYHEPNKNRVVSDGKTLKIYEHDNQQMFVKKVQETEYPGAFSFIMGKGLRSNFTFEFHEAAQWEGGRVLVGRPRVANPGYKVVLFYIDEQLLQKNDPACVRRVLVVDAQGNRNRFDFIHVEQPESIPASEFRFEPPKGTTILK
ncbi:MAG TPA: outer membrane lipoprotein carrier protein LolA [Polyangiaceae bacterium]|nr:outer membrane lipoprotein carrier protein LolA [Polyangiaceae bacterium]